MNSTEILRQLNRLVNDRQVPRSVRKVIEQATRHIILQDDEMLNLKEDITDLKIPRENQD